MKKEIKENQAKGWLSRIWGLRGAWRSLGVIVLAAVMLEMISAIQYYYARNLLEDELEHRVLSELHSESFILKETLNSAEQTLKEHLWDVHQNLARPDSIFPVLKRIVFDNKKVVGACLAFKPYYYPNKGRLYEPYAYQYGDKIYTEQVGGKDDHDYTQHPVYHRMLVELKPFWSNPYKYQGATGVQLLTTYSYPLFDKRDSLIAIYGIDVSLTWLGDTLNMHHEKRHFHHHHSSFNMLLTKQGELVSSPPESMVSKKRCDNVVALINDIRVKREFINDNNITISVIEFYDKYKEDDGYIYTLSMQDAPFWQVVLVCYDDEVYGKLDTMRLYIGLLMLFGFLLISFITHRTTLNLIRLQQADMEKERIEGELRVAHEIQQSMLPKQYTPDADFPDLDIHGSLAPAREVGGDLFDFFIRDEKLFFCIGDVSGKGVPSSIIMAQTHALFRVVTLRISNPEHIMQMLNAMLCQNNESNMFVTFFIGILDLPTGRLRYCNAGHDRPVIVGQGSIDANPHLPLGVFADTKFTQQEMMLPTGTMIFLYTDGLTEAKNAARQQFGLERVMEALTEHDSCEALINHMTESVHHFVKGAEQSDDLTMLAIRYVKQKYTDVLNETIELRNDIRETRQLSEFIKEVTRRLSMPTKLTHDIRLAVEEAVVNVMQYGYPEGQDGNIIINIQSNGSQIKITITDNGMPFDPTEKEDADTTLSVEERPIGGLGVHLIREMMDSINYERENGQNVLTLRKKYK